MIDQEVSKELLAFIRNRFLDGDPDRQLDVSTPLLEWGVLNSSPRSSKTRTTSGIRTSESSRPPRPAPAF